MAGPTESPYQPVMWPAGSSEPEVVTAYESDRPPAFFCSLDADYNPQAPEPRATASTPRPASRLRVPQPRRRRDRLLGGGRPRAVVRSSSRGGDSGDSSDDPEPAGPGAPVGGHKPSSLRAVP